MPVLAPKLGEVLVKTTHSKDIDDALNKVFSEYLELKVKKLQETIEEFQKKWGMSFDEFGKHLKEGISKGEAYSYNTENDYWQWEEAETLKKHYEEIKKQWT